MSSPGTLGGYSVPQTAFGLLEGINYPLGPAQWQAGLTWPLRKSGHVYASDLNRQLSQPLAFLSRKPMFQGVQDSAQAIATSATIPVTLDTEITDPWGMHNVRTDASKVVVPIGCDGIWLVQGTVPFAASASGHYYSTQITYNGSTVISGERMEAASTRVEPECADLIAASSGDIFQLAGFQTTGSSVNTWVSTPSTPAVAYNDFASPLFTCRWVASADNVPGGLINVAVPAGWVNDFTAIAETVAVPLGISAPSTWTSLEEVTAAQFNADIRNNILFLSHVPAVRVWASGAVPAVPSGGTGTPITGLTPTIDNWGAWSNAASKWTCPLSGEYLLYGQVGFPQEPVRFTATAKLNCNVSGTGVSYSGAAAYSVAPAGIVMKQLHLTAGDTVQLAGTQNCGVTIAPSNQTNTRFFALWMSA